MKAIVYLPLLTTALLLGWYLFAPSGDSQPTPPAVVTAPQQAAQLPALPSTNTTRHRHSAAELPASVRGTEVDGRLEVDAQRNLVVSSQVRHLFDYFLSLVGEESVEASEQRIRTYLTGQLEQPALDQALALLDNYLEYQLQVVETESRFPVTETLEDLIAREQAIQRLRATLFSRDAHEAFFAGEEIYNNFTLERLTIARDDFMDEQQKAQAIEALRENLPEEMQQLLVPQIQQDLREQTLALRDAGADAYAVRELRMGMLGPEATERLEQLDRQRSEWHQRVQAFQHERDIIMAQPGLAASDRQAAVTALLQEQFTETEQLRLNN